MKTLKYNFDKIQEKNPYYSTYVCFSLAVEKQNYCKRIIQTWFNKLVDKNDYAKDEKKSLVDYLWQLSKSW